jgi:hypothetical protein
MLPDDVLGLVFSHLSQEGFTNVRLVCKNWKTVADELAAPTLRCLERDQEELKCHFPRAIICPIQEEHELLSVGSQVVLVTKNVVTMPSGEKHVVESKKIPSEVRTYYIWNGIVSFANLKKMKKKRQVEMYSHSKQTYFYFFFLLSI